MLSPKLLETWCGVVGLKLPDKLALGAATGQLASSSNWRAAGCPGARNATVLSPAEASLDMFECGRRGRTSVKGPGQNFSAA